MNSDIFRWGFIIIKWHIVNQKMKSLHPPKYLHHQDTFIYSRLTILALSLE